MFRSTFRVEVDGGEPVEMLTRPLDFYRAEADMARQKIENPAGTVPVHFQSRLVWRAWQRSYPDAPGAGDFMKFMEVCDEYADITPKDEQGDPLTPTQPADTENLP